MSQFRFVSVLAVLLFTMLAGATRAAAQDASAPGTEAPSIDVLKAVSTVQVGKADAVDATDNPCTTSTAFVDIPVMAKSFKIAGAVSVPVIVLFQAEWIPNSDRALIRLTIDGVVQSGPGDAGSPFAPHEGTGVATNGFNFISDAVAPGVHTARIQWASVGGGSICVDERSLIVLHK
jgi:hypothetical protein